MHRQYRVIVQGLVLGSFLQGAPLVAETLSGMDACLLEMIRNADAAASVGQLRAECETRLSSQDEATQSADPEQVVEEELPAESASIIAQRMKAEKATRYNPFVLSPHKQNYVLLASYNEDPNYEIYNIPRSDFDRIEMKFQLSFKMPVVEGVFGTDADLYAAYTQLSFWQAYNRNISSPFRETVHEPEMFLVVPNDWSVLGWKNSLMQFGFVHQSNGQSGYLSRSWNRLYANFLFEKDDFLIGVRPWHRIPDSDDDNPDIADFLGHYELRGIYKRDDHTFSLMTRNLFENRGHETFQVDWSFPLYKRWRGYVQYFSGYGESLVDYDADIKRFGVGVQLTDWL
jgi:phospholipase A1